MDAAFAPQPCLQLVSSDAIDWLRRVRTCVTGDNYLRDFKVRFCDICDNCYRPKFLVCNGATVLRQVATNS